MNKIAVLWPNQLLNEERVRIPGVSIYENVGVLNAPEISATLKSSGFQAVVCTGGIEAAVRLVTDLPMYVVTSGYIDILESFRRLEEAHGISGKNVALLLHENNRIQLSRIAPFVHNRIMKFTFPNQARIPDIQREIVAQRFDAILTGPTGLAMTRDYKLAIPAYSIVYSEESLLDAVAQVNSMLDMSRKEVLRANRVQAALDAAPYAIFATDEMGVINLCNRQAARMLSKAKEGILNRPVTEVLGDPSWRRVYAEGVAQKEVLVKVGRTDYFSTRIPIIQNRQIIGSVGTLQEVEQIQTMAHKFRSLQARGLTAKYRFEDIVFQSDRMRQVVEQAKIYADTDLTVLIEGETGTGKEMVAQSIHNASGRRNGPFVAINCAALSESLLESELMGYEEGAFTGAKKGGKIGLFELAHNGTLFLDELNQLPYVLQSKLLRVIQERMIIRVGGTRMIPVNVRLIAASNEALKLKAVAGQFRADLYYRINILHLQLPALRERREDILPLIQKFAYEKGGENDCIHALYRSMLHHDWPGNIRELENYVWRSVVLYRKGVPFSTGVFPEVPLKEKDDEPNGYSGGGKLSVTLGTLSQMEKQLIAKVLEGTGNNQSKAAKILGVSRNTITNRLR